MNTSHYLTLPAKNYEKIIEDQVIEAEASSFRLSRCDVDMMKPESILMHPLPINREAREIAPDVDDHPRAVYLGQQAAHGYPLRVALLAGLFGKDLSTVI